VKILSIASEVFPFAKVGGLADVTSSLAMALQDLGHQPCLIMPRYKGIRASIQEIQGQDFAVSFMGRYEQINLSVTRLRNGVPVYLVENDALFGTNEVYGQGELERFFFFSSIMPSVIRHLGIEPDIVHFHDWHTSLVPMVLRQAKLSLPSVFTMHNVAYQGSFDQEFFLRSGLSSLWQEYIPADAPRPPLSFMSQGILLADILTTVSPTYSSEILAPQHGEGLEQLLNYRRDSLYGIINGLDYEEYDPAADPHLEANYDSSSIKRRIGNKLALQRKSGLPENSTVPLFGMVSRLDEQKGIDLLLQAVDPFIQETGAQLVILGEGREHYHRALGEAASKYRRRLSVTIARDEGLARLIYGGSDMFLMPSRFEPCGLGQLIAMRYGSVPVVRHTGGLVDTVKDVAEENGNGFVFQEYAVPRMLEAIKRAEADFHRQADWQSLARRNMKLDFSWKASAGKYEKVYLRARNASQATGC
jgi:starch synthase